MCGHRHKATFVCSITHPMAGSSRVASVIPYSPYPPVIYSTSTNSSFRSPPIPPQAVYICGNGSDGLQWGCSNHFLPNTLPCVCVLLSHSFSDNIPYMELFIVCSFASICGRNHSSIHTLHNILTCLYGNILFTKETCPYATAPPPPPPVCSTCIEGITYEVGACTSKTDRQCSGVGICCNIMWHWL